MRASSPRLQGGDIDALIELSDVLEASGTPEKIRSFMLQLLFELLPDTAREPMAAAAEAEGHSTVIDFFMREPRDELAVGRRTRASV